jgi:hypothetical protein
MNRKQAEEKVRSYFGQGLGTMKDTDGTEIKIQFQYNTKDTQMWNKYSGIIDSIKEKFGENSIVTHGYSSRGHDTSLSIIMKPDSAESAKQHVLDTLQQGGVQDIEIKQSSYLEELVKQEMQKSRNAPRQK